MYRIILSLLLLFCLISCGEQNQKTSFRSFESIRPKAKLTRMPTKKTNVVVKYRTVDMALLKGTGICTDSIIPDTSPIFLSRFNPVFKEQLHVYCGKENTEFDYYEFKDSIALLNAMYNWFDRFEYQRNGFRIGQQEPVKKVCFLMKRSEKCLIFIHASNPLKFPLWSKYIETLFPEMLWRMELENTPRQIKWKGIEEIQVAHENR